MVAQARFVGMGNILRKRAPLQIGNRIICFVSIFVIDALRRTRSWEECSSDHYMHKKAGCFVVLAQADSYIPGVLINWLKHNAFSKPLVFVPSLADASNVTIYRPNSP